MLNYSKALWFGTFYVRGRGPILLDDVNCHGNEKSLEYCQHRNLGQHNCGHYADVGVRCGNLTKGKVNKVKVAYKRHPLESLYHRVLAAITGGTTLESFSIWKLNFSRVNQIRLD